MLTLTVPSRPQDVFDESISTFITVKPQTLKLEHSLLSLSKWESKWKKYFIGNKDKTPEEVADYIRCMTVNTVDQILYGFLSEDDVRSIKDYIDDPMTATTIGKAPNERPSRSIITSELIYYWMISYNIPVEFERWHLNRLLTLIKVCNIKNSPPKKMSRKEAMARQTALNAERHKKIQRLKEGQA